MKCVGLLILELLVATPLAAQTGMPVKQSGNVTLGHPMMWVTDGVAGDAGTAAQGFLTSLGVTASGPALCQNSGPITGAYNQLCFNVTSTGAGFSLNNIGGATGGFSLTLNGSPTGLPSALIVGSSTITSGANGNIEFNNSGVLGEKGVSGSGNVVLVTGATLASPTVTGAFTAIGLVTNADLANSTITINSTSCTLGSSCTVTSSPNFATAVSINNNSGQALAVGPAGITNPIFQVEADHGTGNSGINVYGLVAGSGTGFNVISPNASEVLALDAKGSSTINMNFTGTGAVFIGHGLSVIGSITSNSNAGVTCPTGLPSSSFATDHGIVIHC
jgi:hypothetical protein